MKLRTLNQPTIAQREYVEAIRAKHKISVSLLDDWCRDRYGLTPGDMDKRQMSLLLDEMTTWTRGSLPVDLRMAAGQLPMFGEATP